MRNRLDRESGRSGRVLSQEVEHRLRQSLNWPVAIQKEWGPSHIKAFAQLVSQCARFVEGAVGAPPFKPDDRLAWHRNAFTHAALTSAISAILEHFKPGGKLSVPKAVKASAARFARVDPDHSIEHYCTPAAVGMACASGLVVQLQSMGEEPPPLNPPPNERYAEAFYVMPQILRDLGIEYDDVDGRNVGLSRPPKRRGKAQKWPVAG